MFIFQLFIGFMRENKIDVQTLCIIYYISIKGMDDILQIIFKSSLSARSVLNCAQVCKLWLINATSNDVWKMVCGRQYWDTYCIQGYYLDAFKSREMLIHPIKKRKLVREG